MVGSLVKIRVPVGVFASTVPEEFNLFFTAIEDFKLLTAYN